MQQPYTQIEFAKSAFNCPLCGAYSEHQWSFGKKVDYHSAINGGTLGAKDFIEELVFSYCTHL